MMSKLAEGMFGGGGREYELAMRKFKVGLTEAMCAHTTTTRRRNGRKVELVSKNRRGMQCGQPVGSVVVELA
jgi:hypothetical protein